MFKYFSNKSLKKIFHCILTCSTPSLGWHPTPYTQDLLACMDSEHLPCQGLEGERPEKAELELITTFLHQSKEPVHHHGISRMQRLQDSGLLWPSGCWLASLYGHRTPWSQTVLSQSECSLSTGQPPCTCVSEMSMRGKTRAQSQSIYLLLGHGPPQFVCYHLPFGVIHQPV